MVVVVLAAIIVLVIVAAVVVAATEVVVVAVVVWLVCLLTVGLRLVRVLVTTLTPDKELFIVLTLGKLVVMT